jgi:hypothetical protein
MTRARARVTVFVLIVATAIIFGAFVSAGGADDPGKTLELKVVPKPIVTAGRRVLATSSFANEGAAAVTNVKILFFIPAGSFDFASPSEGCFTKTFDHFVTTVICDIGTVEGGQAVTQFVALTAPSRRAKVNVISQVVFKEGPKDFGTKFASDSTRIAAVGAQDEFGGCPIEAGTFTTVPASGAGNPQSTSIEFGLSDDLPCTPIAIGEQPSTPENPGCPAGVKCTTQVSFVTLPPLPEAATVTLKFDGSILRPGTTPENFALWETPDTFPADPIRRVQRCPLPEGEDSCIVRIEKFGYKGLKVLLRVTGLGVNGSGGGFGDPRYRG